LYEFEFLSRFSVGGCGVGLMGVVVWMVRWCHQHGMSALHWASAFGHLPVVEFLVKIGQDTNVANKVRSLSVARKVW
jgi:hypothetical protein